MASQASCNCRNPPTDTVGTRAGGG
jgi:hypothetical protein